VVGFRPLDDVRAIVLATDGLSEVGIGLADPAAAVAEIVAGAASRAADLRPLETAREVVEAALAAHRENQAGDNAAAGVVWFY
jgi:serine/threonine protein phosphatase PrpC